MYQVAANRAECWPALPVSSWKDTFVTLHMWTQIVGKVPLGLTPVVNHWWNIPLYVTASGLTTSRIERFWPNAACGMRLHLRSCRGLASREARKPGSGRISKILNHPGVVLYEPIGALAHLGLGRAHAHALQGATQVNPLTLPCPIRYFIKTDFASCVFLGRAPASA
jgi:hypothetical protein